MIQLVYVSSATYDITQDELVTLLEKSREKNARLGITGMLLYANGNFFQVLEGEKDAVEELYHTIQRDERHTDCFMIDESEIDNRNFEDWSMGFRYLEAKEIISMEGYSDFLMQNSKPKDFLDKKASVIGLLYNFKETNR